MCLFSNLGELQDFICTFTVTSLQETNGNLSYSEMSRADVADGVEQLSSSQKVGGHAEVSLGKILNPPKKSP